MTKQNVNSWLRTNLWNLIITAGIIIVAFTTLQIKVAAMASELEQLENIVAEYPSKDYFELKFKTLDKQIDNIQTTLNSHIGIE
jgi:hypothetical protein